jgi:hypothetical protein
LDLGGFSVAGSFIYGLEFNTQDYGNNPYRTPGPYNGLHFAMSGDIPAVGSNPLPDTVFWNTAIAANYHDGGVGGVGTFRPDDGWAPFSPAIQFDTEITPEPSTVSLFVLSLTGLFALTARRFSTTGPCACRAKEDNDI